MNSPHAAATNHAGKFFTMFLILVGVSRVVDLDGARQSAYAAVERIVIRGGHHRRDIAERAARGLIAIPR